ncbi:MAG: DUF2723 domain-containing protein [Ignavibacteria bacterium]|nr:DUF2723 domain-containing protein [Ignavibacteria bacterium]
MKNIIGRGLASPGFQAAVLGLLVFATYVLTMAPGLMYTDSGELAAACTTLGVAHPTGYPLFTLLGHVWTMMSWGSPVAALNVLAGVWVASSVSVMYLLVLPLLARVHGPRVDHLYSIIAASGALVLGWSSVVWAQATSIEVYSLHLLLFSLTLLFAFKSANDVYNAQRWTTLAGLFYGLMLANHLSSAFLAPGFILVWLSGDQDRRLRLRNWAYVVIPALAGVALYAVLPLRSMQEPPINWGMVHRDLSSFLYHVKGTQFGVWMFSDKKAFSDNVAMFWSLLSSTLLWVGLVPAAVGLWRTIASRRSVAVGLMAIVAGNLGISLGYAIPDLEPYFLPTILVAVLLFCVGLPTLLQKLPSRLHWAALAMPMVLVVVGWQQQDRSDHTAVDNYTTWVFDNAEPNAIILTRQWDYFCSAAWYRQVVDHERTDITLIDKELLRRTWYAPYLLQRYPNVMKKVQPEVDAYMPYLELFESDADAFNKNQGNVRIIQQRFVALLNALLTANPDRPVYITPELLSDEQGFAEGYERRPAGPLVRLTRDTLTYLQKHGIAGLEELVTSLRGRSDRLDKGLQQTALAGFGTMAFYQLDAFTDTAGFRRYRDLARRLDPKDRITRQLDGVIP